MREIQSGYLLLFQLIQLQVITYSLLLFQKELIIKPLAIYGR